MDQKKLKSNKGITLLALTIYILIFVLLIGVMTTVSTFFFRNVHDVVDTPRYVSEFNKFAMFFVIDIKNYSQATVTENTIEFEDGPIYEFANNAIFRNDVVIATRILNCNFTLKEYSVSSITKNLINVDIKIGTNEENSVTRNVDFTLRYW